MNNGKKNKFLMVKYRRGNETMVRGSLNNEIEAKSYKECIPYKRIMYYASKPYFELYR